MWPVITKPARSRRAPHRRFLPDSASSTTTGAEPANCRRQWGQFVQIFAHLVVLFVVFLRFRLEGRGFQQLVGVAMASLPIHYLLPYRLKKVGFVAISL